MSIKSYNYKGVIFDLDGTLIDSSWVWDIVDRDFLGKRGFAVPDDYVQIIAPMGVIATAQYTIKRFNLNETVEAVTKEWHDMAIDAYTNKVILKPGAKEYIDYLKKNNIKMSIATASDEALVNPVLENNNITKYFDNITTIKEVKRGKGFPDVYNAAAKKMNLYVEECIVFEDILTAAKGAIDGGYRTIGVYDEKSAHDKDEMTSICHRYIYDFKEMIE